MSLLVLMYHRARAGRYGNSPEILAAHFAHISDTYPNVMPGGSLATGTLNICLSFDDGYFDFYATVFPLLKKYNLRALLAIPPEVVCERVDVAAGERLGMASDEAFAHPDRGGFCSWVELEEMAASGYVTIAAHGLRHCRLDAPDADLERELDAPKNILGARLGQPIESFVFPFGRYSPDALRQAKRRYRYLFRIGGALNRSWESRLLYRIGADAMETPRSLFLARRLATYRARYLWNRLRFR
jgi:peptidoglycan/xylan/chitin deacetylase (PgdA/CDA1 family)